MAIKDVLTFIQNLELPATDAVASGSTAAAAAPAPAAVPAQTTAQSASVDGGSLMSFVAGVSPQNKQDALNSTLLASLAASAAYDRETQTVEWYESYRNILSQVGWDLQAFSFSQYNTSGASFNMSQAVLEILAAVLTPDELAVATATLTAMQQLSQGDGRLTLFNHSAATDSNGNFQINVVNQAPNGVMSMTIGAFYFSAGESTTNFLWATFSTSDSSMYSGTQSVTLDRQVYAQVRAAIIAKLGANANTFINDLQLSSQ